MNHAEFNPLEGVVPFTEEHLDADRRDPLEDLQQEAEMWAARKHTKAKMQRRRLSDWL